EHSLAIAESMAGEQSGDLPADADGERPAAPARVTAVAARSEGMLAAYRLARAVNSPRSDALAAAVRAAARFQLSQQFDHNNSFFLPNPARALGGFHESTLSMAVRIDYVQHNISS